MNAPRPISAALWACTDAELLGHIRQVLEDSPFHRAEPVGEDLVLGSSVDCVGIHAAKSGNRFEALEPIRQGVARFRIAGVSSGPQVLACLSGANCVTEPVIDLEREVEQVLAVLVGRRDLKAIGRMV